MLGQAWYSYQGRVTGFPSTKEFYASLTLVFVPSALIILSRRATKLARIGFALYLSLALIATRFMLFPMMFAYHDEVIHQFNVVEIDKTHHLFSPNYVLPVTPYYSGIEIATTAVEHLTGLPFHAAATVLLIVIRVVMTLGMIRLFQLICGSATISAMGALVYTVNPQYLFFNSEYSYQTVALPLSFFCIYVFSIRSRRLGVWGVVPSVIVTLAVAASHHLTAIGLLLVLWTWYLYTRFKNHPVPHLVHFAILSTLVVGVWTWIARKEVIPYITQIVQKNIHGINTLAGGSTGHKLFSDAAGDKTPEWQVLLSLASVMLVLLILIPASWYTFKKRYALQAASLSLATAAALYPIIPAGHLSSNTSEVADRTAGFIFVGIAFIFATWWYSWRPQRLYGGVTQHLTSSGQRRRPTGRFRIPRAAWLPIVILTVCFAGGIADGSGPDWAYGPGAYLVSADNRSIDQTALQAAYWEAQHLSANSRVFTDRDNALLAQTYGKLQPLTALGNGISEGSLSQLLLSPSTEYDTQIACDNEVQFLIADQRLSTSLPHLGIYIDNGEYLWGSRTTPPPASAFVKFDGTPGAERIFDNGAIRIYNLEGLACQS